MSEAAKEAGDEATAWSELGRMQVARAATGPEQPPLLCRTHS